MAKKKAKIVVRKRKVAKAAKKFLVKPKNKIKPKSKQRLVVAKKTNKAKKNTKSRLSYGNLKAKKAKSKKVFAKKMKVKKPVLTHQRVRVNKVVAKKKIARKPKKILEKAVKKANVAKRKSVAREKVEKNIPVQKEQFAAEALFKAKIKVVGIGGGGGSIVSEIGKSLQKATFVVADTDIRALKKKPGIKYHWFGKDLTRGLGTGSNVELAKKAAELEKDKISEIFKDQDIVIFIACLGGGLGSGATEVFAKAAEEFGGITFGIFTLPFKFEGKSKQKIAYKALRQLREALNVSITIPNERIFKIIDANTPIVSAFSLVNKNLIESLESLIDLIYNPGIINIDFADLRTILRGKGNLAFFNTIEESGKDRAENISQKILDNPLYQNNNFTAEKILFNISGGANLSMFEVEKISRSISELNPQAKIIFGISKNNKAKNKIKTTILMTGPALGEKIKEPMAEKTESKKEEIISEKAENLPAGRDEKPKNKRKLKNKKPKKPEKKEEKQKENVVPVFNNNLDNLKIPVLQNETVVATDVMLSENEPKKKTIRRTAIEAKKVQEIEENKRFLQEEEWEIPAFLRRGKI